MSIDYLNKTGLSHFWSKNKALIKKDYDRTVSRGEQLITNGNGMLGDNTNFSIFLFDGSKANGSPGAFTLPAGTVSFPLTDDFFPVTPSLRYLVNVDAVSNLGVGCCYLFLDFYDVDKKRISARNCMYVSNTLTTLSQDLKEGDTVVHLTDLTNWKVTGTTHQKSFIFWNYMNSFGYTYPEHTYSRNVYLNLYNADSAVDKTSKTITLKTAWPGPTIPAGTKVSQGSDGSTYKYVAMVNAVIPTVWKSYSGMINGTDYSGTNVSNKFPPGTAYAKVGFYWNYQGAGNNEQLWVTNISVKEVPEIVNGYIINSDVPSDAVFTDTTSLTSMTGTLPISHGGTNASTAAAARSSLEITPSNIGAVATSAIIDIEHGGTGSSTAAAARTALGLGTAAVAATAASVGNNSNLPTGAAIQTYVTGLGYEANQNAFSNVAVGSSTIAADTKTDTLTLVGSGSVSISANTSTDTITISGTNTTYGSATTAAAGLMSADDKSKLNNIASGAQVNQNAFTTVKVGTTNLVADTKTDTLTITAGNNITLTPTASSDSFSISSTNTTYSVATTTADGLMSKNDKAALDNLVSSNSSFGVITNGVDTISASAPNDTFSLLAGENISIVGDPANNNMTITGTKNGTVTSVTAGTGLKVGSATSGGSITSSGTINHINSITAGTAGSSSASSGATLAVPYVTYDSTGHITGKGTHTHTINSLAASAISSGTLSTARLPVLPIEKGGTGATNTTDALSNLYGTTWDFQTKNTTDRWVPVFTDNNGPIQHREIPLEYNEIPLGIDAGGTGSTTRLDAAKTLTNEKVGTDATHFVTLTTSWGKFGYTDLSDAKDILEVPTITHDYISSSSSVSVANNTVTKLMQFTLTPGLYIVTFGTSFNSNSTGYRRITLNTSSSNSFTWDRSAVAQQAANGTGNGIHGIKMLNITSNTTYYFWVQHNAGAALTCYPYYEYIKIA